MKRKKKGGTEERPGKTNLQRISPLSGQTAQDHKRTWEKTWEEKMGWGSGSRKLHYLFSGIGWGRNKGGDLGKSTGTRLTRPRRPGKSEIRLSATTKRVTAVFRLGKGGWLGSWVGGEGVGGELKGYGLAGRGLSPAVGTGTAMVEERKSSGRGRPEKRGKRPKRGQRQEEKKRIEKDLDPGEGGSPPPVEGKGP